MRLLTPLLLLEAAEKPQDATVVRRSRFAVAGSFLGLVARSGSLVVLDQQATQKFSLFRISPGFAVAKLTRRIRLETLTISRTILKCKVKFDIVLIGILNRDRIILCIAAIW
jgi:hypothetical protein